MTTVLESLNAGLHEAFATSSDVYLLGEDVLDPYGGAFKVTRGLSSTYPERVLTTPVSEAGITGIAAGMALRGLRPVVEIMFGDFVTLIADQLINHVAKFRWMYNEQVRVPIVVRTPMGGRRGYGPTHSQTLEKLYLGIPGLVVLAPTNIGNPGKLLFDAILNCDEPVLFIENKLLYLLLVHGAEGSEEFDIRESLTPLTLNKASADKGYNGLAPTYTLSVRGAPSPSLTMSTYGFMTEIACQAALRLAYEYEIFTELVVPTQLAPFETHNLIESLRNTKRLLAIEEGTRSLGWGAEILARCAETSNLDLRAARRLAALEIPIPASGALEHRTLPDIEQIIETCLDITQRG